MCGYNLQLCLQSMLSNGNHLRPNSQIINEQAMIVVC